MDVVGATGAGFDDSVLGATRRNCVCDALNYIQSVIIFPTTILSGTPIELLFDFSQNTPSSTILGFASPSFPPSFFASVPGYYGGYVYDYITTGIDPSPSPASMEHGKITINFGHSFGYCTSSIADCQYDFELVVLHEFTHLLGVGSLMTENATTFLLESNAAPNVFSEFDNLFLWYYNGATFDKMVDTALFSANGGISCLTSQYVYGFRNTQ